MYTKCDLVKEWDKFMLEEEQKSPQLNVFGSKEEPGWNGYVSDSSVEDSSEYESLASIPLPSRDESTSFIGNQHGSSFEDSLDHEKLSSIAKPSKNEPRSLIGHRRSGSECKGSLGSSFDFDNKRPSTAQARYKSSFSGFESKAFIGNHHGNELNRPSTANVRSSSMSNDENDGKLHFLDSSESDSRLVLGESSDYENKPNIYDDNEWNKFLGISHTVNESHKRRPLTAKQPDKSSRRIDELYKLGKKKVTIQRLRASTVQTPKHSTPHTPSRTLTPLRRTLNTPLENTFNNYLPNDFRQKKACERLYEYSSKMQEEGKLRRKAIEKKIRSNSIHC